MKNGHREMFGRTAEEKILARVRYQFVEEVSSEWLCCVVEDVLSLALQFSEVLHNRIC